MPQSWAGLVVIFRRAHLLPPWVSWPWSQKSIWKRRSCQQGIHHLSLNRTATDSTSLPPSSNFPTMVVKVHLQLNLKSKHPTFTSPFLHCRFNHNHLINFRQSYPLFRRRLPHQAPPFPLGLLCWNNRGVGSPCTVRLLQALVRRYYPDILVLLETKLKLLVLLWSALGLV